MPLGGWRREGRRHREIRRAIFEVMVLLLLLFAGSCIHEKKVGGMALDVEVGACQSKAVLETIVTASTQSGVYGCRVFTLSRRVSIGMVATIDALVWENSLELYIV